MFDGAIGKSPHAIVEALEELGVAYVEQLRVFAGAFCEAFTVEPQPEAIVLSDFYLASTLGGRQGQNSGLSPHVQGSTAGSVASRLIRSLGEFSQALLENPAKYLGRFFFC